KKRIPHLDDGQAPAVDAKKLPVGRFDLAEKVDHLVERPGPISLQPVDPSRDGADGRDVAPLEAPPRRVVVEGRDDRQRPEKRAEEAEPEERREERGRSRRSPTARHVASRKEAPRVLRK